MNEHQLANSFRRIAKDLIADGHPANSVAKAIMDEAEQLDPPPKPREWWVSPHAIENGFVTTSPHLNWIHFREVIE